MYANGVIEQPMQCSPAMLRMYVDYHNHTLDDYLSLIRVKGSAVSFPELVYLMRSLV